MSLLSLQLSKNCCKKKLRIEGFCIYKTVNFRISFLKNPWGKYPPSPPPSAVPPLSYRTDLVKVTRIGEVMGRKRPPTLREPSFKFRHWNGVIEVRCLHYAKIIRIIINIDDIRQGRPSEGPILNLNTRLK